jgi:hypothetical protein
VRTATRRSQEIGEFRRAMEFFGLQEVRLQEVAERTSPDSPS